MSTNQDKDNPGSSSEVGGVESGHGPLGSEIVPGSVHATNEDTGFHDSEHRESQKMTAAAAATTVSAAAASSAATGTKRPMEEMDSTDSHAEGRGGAAADKQATDDSKRLRSSLVDDLRADRDSGGDIYRNRNKSTVTPPENDDGDDGPATPSAVPGKDDKPGPASNISTEHDTGPSTKQAVASNATAASAAAAETTVTTASSLDSGWGDQDEYDQMPKTPVAPRTSSTSSSGASASARAGMVRRQSTGGASAASSTSDLSSIAGGGASYASGGRESDNDDLSRTMSPAMYVPEVPPAPPSTPASTTPYVSATSAGGRPILQRDFGSATPLPYYNTSTMFVQNARLLERQQLLADGAVTPAPPGRRTSSIGSFADLPSARTTMTMMDDGAMTPHAGAADTATATTEAASAAASASTSETGGPPPPGSIPKKPNESLIDDFSEWAVGDRYQLERMLGRGSYGEVAQAIDLHRSGGGGSGTAADATAESTPATTVSSTPFYVAIKRIQSPFDQEVDAVRLFRELHILRRLRGHDCIIKLLDVIQPPSDDLNDFHDLYLVFEYVDTDLYKLIMSPQYLTTEHIQTFLYQMLAGLKYIHSANCIHRDLKPANILLNEDCSLKICDFGLARIVDESAVIHTSGEDSDEKKIGMATDPPTSFAGLSPKKQPLQRQLTKHVVTRWYRAPELILIQPYTTAVDIWSLGCIFAELLSMQEGSVPGYQDRTPLFPGGACYPLSGDTDNAERLDQLSVIFGVIGTPSLEDVKLVGKASEYIKQMGMMKPKKFESLYPAADPIAIDLLEKMLKFNPRQRITASEALDHEFFRGIRRKEMETTIDKPLESPPFLHEHDIDIDVLKRKTYEEVIWFKDRAPSSRSDTTTI